MEKLNELFVKFKESRKTQIITVVVLLIVLGIVGMVIFSDDTQNSNDNNNSTSQKTANQLDTSEAYRLIDGIKITKNRANFLPVAIVVENYAGIRPQSGLADANIVYEALAEGGITRFLAIYASGTDVKTIGPVRSARHYFVDVAEEYGGIFAHIGGSPQALGILSFEEYITDLNQFTYSQYYWRDDNIAAPHNLFTSSELMSYAIRDLLSENPEGNYTAWKFKDENASSVSIDKYIKIDYSLDQYAVEWKYNTADNIYMRFNGDKEHKDALTDKQLTAKNIIVQFADTSLLEGEAERLDIKTIGEGEALIFLDGEVISGTWKKSQRGDRTLYYDKNNQEIEFNRGNTWVEMVKLETSVQWTDNSGSEQSKN
ncbi:MAG: DUF3048 domain-containing protein [Patescibacteria group bacterium]